MACYRVNFTLTLPSLLNCFLAWLFDQSDRHVHGWFVVLLVGKIAVWLFCWLVIKLLVLLINPLTPNDHYSGRTAPLTSKRCILYICSTNIGTEYFKHGIYSPFFPLQNAVCLINLTYLVPVLFTFYIQGVLKLKKIIPAPKG